MSTTTSPPGPPPIRYLQEHYAGQHIYALATDSFLKECRHSGLQITTNARDKTITCVLVSYDSALTYEKIKDVCLLLTTPPGGLHRTNPDLVCPVDFGYLPDCGAICNMIETRHPPAAQISGQAGTRHGAVRPAGCRLRPPGRLWWWATACTPTLPAVCGPGWTPPWCSAARPTMADVQASTDKPT